MFVFSILVCCISFAFALALDLVLRGGEEEGNKRGPVFRI